LAKAYYATTSRHYDPSWQADPKLNDVPFWLDLAARYPGHVLEAACGTGRVLLSLARAGLTVDGLDLTPQLLGILKEKLQGEPPEVQRRVTLHEGDMRDFQVGRSYDLIILPFRPLQHLLTLDDQLRAFQALAAHLKVGGHLAFNVFYPNYVWLDKTGEEDYEEEWPDPEDPALTVRRYFLREAHHRLHQRVEGQFIFRTFRGPQLVREESSPLHLCYYTYPPPAALAPLGGLDGGRGVWVL